MVDAVASDVGYFVPSYADCDLRGALWYIQCLDDQILHRNAPWYLRKRLEDLSRLSWFADRDVLLPGWIPETAIDLWEWRCRGVDGESERY